MEIQQNHSPDSDDGWGDEDKISQTSSKPLTGKLLPRIEMFPFTGAFKPSPGSSAKSNPFFKNLPSPKNGDYQGPPTIQLTGLEKSFSRMTLFSPPPGEVRILDVTTPDAVSTAVSTVTSPVGSMSFSPPPVGDVEIVAAPSPVSVAPSAAKIETKPVVSIPISTPPREGKVPVVAIPEHVPSVEPTLPSPQKEVVKIAIATTPEPILASSAAKVTPSVASPLPSPEPRDVKMANVNTPEPAPSAVAKVFSPVASPVFSPQPVITPEPRPVTPAPTATIATPVVPSRAVEETRKDYYVTPVKGRPQKHFTWKDAKYSTNLKDAAFVEVSFIWNIETYQIIADEDRQPLFESHAKIVKLLENDKLTRLTQPPLVDDMVILESGHRARVLSVERVAEISPEDQWDIEIVLADLGDTRNELKYYTMFHPSQEIMEVPLFSVKVRLDGVEKKTSYVPSGKKLRAIIKKKLQLQVIEEISIGDKNVFGVILWLGDDLNLNEIVDEVLTNAK